MWWLQLHSILEVKRGSGVEDMLQALKQLRCYMRRLFSEQIDRRFIIGLILCDDKLTVWLCDRSGLIGTAEPIDIHEVRHKSM